ncbi:hypothetical protein [Eremococcus coleocola]|uniref:hypothetical protein n=1 Tax=Eremococcus coleocola TaxID=88132 RepID=UPI000408AC78|nr:hypothetical protein [Eremococcus coleocola]
MAQYNMPAEWAKKYSNKHYTKAEIEEKRRTEIRMKDDEIVPTDSLPDELHDRFYWFIDQFEGTGLMSNLESDTLCRYLVAEKLYWELTAEMAELDYVDPDYTKLSHLQNRYHKQTLDYGKELGIGFLSRNKLRKDKEQIEEEPETKEQKLFGSALGY